MKQFDKLPQLYADTLGLSYDYESILHYSGFQNNTYEGLRTMVLRKNSSVHIGNSTGLSPQDIKEIRRFYKCEHYHDESGSVFTAKNLLSYFIRWVFFCFGCVVAWGCYRLLRNCFPSSDEERNSTARSYVAVSQNLQCGQEWV